MRDGLGPLKAAPRVGGFSERDDRFENESHIEGSGANGKGGGSVTERHDPFKKRVGIETRRRVYMTEVSHT